MEFWDWRSASALSVARNLQTDSTLSRHHITWPSRLGNPPNPTALVEHDGGIVITCFAGNHIGMLLTYFLSFFPSPLSF